jgi:hypothetical protein
MIASRSELHDEVIDSTHLRSEIYCMYRGTTAFIRGKPTKCKGKFAPTLSQAPCHEDISLT